MHAHYLNKTNTITHYQRIQGSRSQIIFSRNALSGGGMLIKGLPSKTV